MNDLTSLIIYFRCGAPAETLSSSISKESIRSLMSPQVALQFSYHHQPLCVRWPFPFHRQQLSFDEPGTHFSIENRKTVAHMKNADHSCSPCSWDLHNAVSMLCKCFESLRWYLFVQNKSDPPYPSSHHLLCPASSHVVSATGNKSIVWGFGPGRHSCASVEEKRRQNFCLVS